jgi:ATP-binding cassette subfamily B protein/subfamily B ATP-binding cassette protein MsbA
MKRQLRLLRYVWPHWPGLTLVLAIMVLHIGLAVIQPMPLMYLINALRNVQGVDREDLHAGGLPDDAQAAVPDWLEAFLQQLPGPSGLQGLIFWVCISTILIWLTQHALDMVNDIVSVTIGHRMVYDLAADLFLHLQRLSPLFHCRQPVGDSASRVLGDSYCVQTLVNSILTPLVHAVISLFAMFFVMWSFDPTLTLCSLAIAPLLIVPMIFLSGRMEERGRVERDQEGLMMTAVEQALSALPAVQAFTREEIEHERFRRIAADTVAAHRASTWIDMWFKLAIGLATAIGTAAIMWFGAQHVISGAVKLGTIYLFLYYLHAFYEPLNAIVQTGSTWQHTVGSTDRVLEILDTPIDVTDAPGAVDAQLHGRIRYENVTFGYEEGQPVLKNVSLEAKPGEVVAIVGPTGAGKTTLINMLVRFFDPWSGRVTIDGQDLRGYRLKSLRQQIALVLQEPFIFPYTIADNIAYGRPDATPKEIQAAALAANAHDYIMRLPQGYQTVVGERGATLSGGEKQRLSIARAFLKNAPILILDEPTSALDARTEARLLDALENLMKNRTTFIIAHRLSTIRNADRILVIDQGEIVEQGSHEELMVHDGLYASLYRQQMDLAQHDLPDLPKKDGEGGREATEQALAAGVDGEKR